MDATIRARQPALATHILHERCPHKSATALTAFWRERIGVQGQRAQWRAAFEFFLLRFTEWEGQKRVLVLHEPAGVGV